MSNPELPKKADIETPKTVAPRAASQHNCAAAASNWAIDYWGQPTQGQPESR